MAEPFPPGGWAGPIRALPRGSRTLSDNAPAYSRRIVRAGEPRRTWLLLIIYIGLSLNFLCLAGSAGSISSDWPMFRGNQQLTGVASGQLDPDLKRLWVFQTGSSIRSSPAVVANRVYVGSDNGQFYSVDAGSGTNLWSYKTGGSIESSPLVLDGRVYVGSSDNFLYALDAASGKLLWKAEAEDRIPGAPNWTSIHGTNYVLFGAYDYKLHCVQAATGQTNWAYETSNYINGAPAVNDGTTAFGGCDGFLHLIDLHSGKELKQIDAGAYVPGSVALEGASAFFGQYESEVRRVDVAHGTNVWIFKKPGTPFFSSPAVTRERVVIGGRDKRLYCLRKSDGVVVWSFAAKGSIDSSAAICDGKAVVGSDDGRVYMVSMETGSLIWSYNAGKSFSASPAIASGRIFIGCEDGNLYCFGPGN